MSPGHGVTVSVALLVLGLVGVMARRDPIGRLAGVQMILAAVLLNFAVFARTTGPPGALTGRGCVVLVALIAVAEIAVGAGLLRAARSRPPGESSGGPEA